VHCRQHAVQLNRAREEFDAAGVGVVLIGQATPRHAAHFRRKFELDLPVLADEKRDSYRAAGAKVATMGELLGPKSVTKGIGRSVKSKGALRQGRMIGHPAQLGGAMIVTPDGRVAWTHMSDDASDNAANEELLEAARSL
jgi:peroxiredoxin